jgi:hypothetical protein
MSEASALVGWRPWRQPEGGQAGGLRQAERQVHALHGGPAGALGEVVDRADRHQAAGRPVDGHLHVHGVRPDDRLGLRPLPRWQQVHERLVGVGLLVRRVGLVRVHGGRRRAGGEDPARHRHEERREGDRHLAVGEQSQALADLGRVPVGAAHAVRTGGAHHLGAQQVRLGGLAGPGGARGGDHHDGGGVDDAGGHGRRQRQRGDGRVAARDRDPGGAGDPRPLVGELRQPVGPRAGVLAAVEVVPGGLVGQPEVGAAVDHHGVLGQLLRDRARLPVRQGEEDDVVTGQHLDRGLLQHPVRERQEVRLQGPEPLTGVRARGDRADLHVGMSEQQPEHLSTGVPAGSGDRRPALRHVHDHTQHGICRATRPGPSLSAAGTPGPPRAGPRPTGGRPPPARPGSP